jgi:uncharacterized alkaline shock family protein YloU
MTTATPDKATAGSDKASDRAQAGNNANAGDGARRHGPPPMNRGAMSLVTEGGKTRIADSVVAKVAGLAARDIPGVYSMGAGMARRMGQLRSLVPGSSDAISQGVSVEVGEREAAVDLDLVTWYGQSIIEVTSAVRENVIDQVQSMTGLKVVEVNISVDDIHVDSDSDDANTESRVQ